MSGTDWMCTKFDIQVEAVLNINYIELMSNEFTGTVTPDNAAAIMKRVRVELLQPRRLLSYKFNNIELIPAQTGGPGTVDVQNGPKPQSCSVTWVTDTTFIINFHIIANYWENNENRGPINVLNRPGSVVLSNRWTETVEIDNCMYSTRTRDGKYIIRSDNDQGLFADMVRRQMAILGVPRGFLRVSSKYTITPDGLGIAYNITDKEYFKTPPNPAFEADGEYTESAGQGGAVKYGSVRLKLKGCKNSAISSQKRLVEVAVSIAASKLAINGSASLKDISVTVGMYDNTVSVNMTALCNKEKATINGVPVASKKARNQNFTANMCYTPGSEDTATAPLYLDTGTASLLLQAAKYYDPNLKNNELVAGFVALPDESKTTNFPSQMNNGLVPGQAGIKKEES